MAIKGNYTTYSKIDLAEAYIKCTEITLRNNSVEVIFSIYANEQARIDNSPIVQNLVIQLTEEEVTQYYGIDVLDGETNPIKQAYEFLKTKEEFIWFTDC